MPEDPRRWGDAAVERGFLSADQLERALDAQRESSPPRALSEILVEQGLLTQPRAHALTKLLEFQASPRSQVPDDMGLAGSVLGGCLLIERIGSGAVGIVYRGHHLRLDRDAAVKILHPRLAKVPGYLQRFEREARTAALLEHPSIVTVYDFDREGEYHFIVMQFAEGQNLRDYCYQRGPLGPKKTHWIAGRVLEGLVHAHERLIIHRDLKPANLVLTREPRVKITDFGLVRMIVPTTGEKLSAFGEILGTPQYMSPEQAYGGEVDPRCDLYSLGITMFELITGRTPFGGGSTVEVLEKQILEPLPSIRKLAPSTPPELEAFVEKLASKAPDDRFPSAAAALEALRAIRFEDRSRSTRLLQSFSLEASGEIADPSRVAAAPPIPPDELIDDLKERLRKSSELSLVAFEGFDPPQPVSDATPVRGTAAPPSVDDVALTIREAAQEGRAEKVVPDLLARLWKAGEHDRILGLERELVACCPTLPAGEFYVGLVHARRGDHERARAKLSLAVALAPDHLPARFHLAKILTQLGRIDEAASVLEQGVSLVPRSFPAALRYAEFLYLVRKDSAAAVPAYERAVELAPGRWQVRQQLAWVLYELDRLEEAESVLREVLEWTDERAPRELLERIEATREEDIPTERFEAEVGKKTSPKISAVRDLIQLSIASGRWERVVELATAALAEKPKTPTLLMARGRALLELGKADAAVRDYSLALTLEKDSQEAADGLRRAQEARKRAR